ncbi:hypothetical protein [Rhodoferax sp.]|uniref:hypothetical protein n=1 Tax=Rhodoferax sp. TaxID=50421 RepID=UPI00374D99F0
MDMLEYMERETAVTLKVVMDDYAASHARAYNFVTLLVGGGGALGAYVLAKLAAPPVAALSWVPLTFLAVWWFAIAVYILLAGLQSNYLSSGPRPDDLGLYFTKKGGNFGDVTAVKNVDALTKTRIAELATRGQRINDHMAAVGSRAQVLNAAYVAAAFSPVVAAFPLIFLLI